MRIAIAFCSLLVIAGCASSEPADAPRTAGKVDLERYQGNWYEVARLPMFFQRDCQRSEADYRLQDDGSMSVVNRCETYDGGKKQAEGRAVPQEQGRTDRLWVRFDNWFSRLLPGVAKGHYWVLYVDEDYRHALVGSPDRENLWLLSRTPEIDAATRERLLDEARQRDYSLDELIWRGEPQR